MYAYFFQRELTEIKSVKINLSLQRISASEPRQEQFDLLILGVFINTNIDKETVHLIHQINQKFHCSRNPAINPDNTVL